MFDAYVAFQAKLRPSAFALITPHRWATYAELDADADRFAAGLRDLGVTRARGVVAIRIANDYLTHVVLLALARLGVVSSPFDDPACDLAIVAAEQAAPGELALSEAWLARTFDAEPRPVEPVRVGPDELIRVMLSSGTTRTARRVPRTWRMLEGNTRTCALTYCAGKPGRWVCLTGMDTGLGQAMTLAAWSQGETLVADYTTGQLAESLEALRPSILGVTPSFLRQLLGELPPGFPVQGAMRIVSTGGVLSPAVAREARLRLAPEILISYGAAETGSTTLADGAWLEAQAGAAGYPVPNVRVEVVGDDGAPMPAGEQGEIRIFSDRQSGGYLGDPEATARAFRDGGFYPGDLGRRLPDGLLIVEGRVDDRMDLGGVKFLPDLLEEVALAYPGVRDAAAYAAPDATGTDVCWLAVVAAPDLDRQGLARHIAASDRDLPEARFAWIEAIPRNAMGKAERRRLRAETIAVLTAR
ncbi:MAG: acyl--CoA ligase [Phenylobacterium sp.]|uniref:class I adenylate-forming enzyme family protein n=1 Tax=Phenylobacterium sp. TaxID=1871053 RepID=UPI001A40E89C|nr:class I adenylate-forming enzyme family protein [Phenylobacterium sp.]MBL8556955.1 acyl--CoA ligase [Phenylobacterium sp.]